MANRFFGTPKLGDQIWYRLDTGFFGEWVPAKVVDRTGDGPMATVYDPPLEEGLLHLEISLDRQRHHSSGTKGYRLNVAEGIGYKQWQRERPSDADAEYSRAREVAGHKAEANREIMRQGAAR